jgi:hypothetical protein
MDSWVFWGAFLGGVVLLLVFSFMRAEGVFHDLHSFWAVLRDWAVSLPAMFVDKLVKNPTWQERTFLGLLSFMLCLMSYERLGGASRRADKAVWLGVCAVTGAFAVWQGCQVLTRVPTGVVGC